MEIQGKYVWCLIKSWVRLSKDDSEVLLAMCCICWKCPGTCILVIIYSMSKQKLLSTQEIFECPPRDCDVFGWIKFYFSIRGKQYE